MWLYRYLAEGAVVFGTTHNNKIHIKYLDGFNRLHRTDGPALISFSEEGVILEQLWYQNGKRHRLDGPALIGKLLNGLPDVQWWVRGQPCEPEDLSNETEGFPEYDYEAEAL